MPDAPSFADFTAFLKRVATGDVTVEDWNQHAITRYQDVTMESARKRLAQAAVTIGQCSARPVQEGLDLLAQQLLDELEA